MLELLRQKKALKQETGVGRALLEIAERLDLLEEKLRTSKTRSAESTNANVQENGPPKWSDEWMDTPTNESDDEYDPSEVTGVPPRLKRRAGEFLILKYLVGKHSPHHPFILAQDGRMRKIQEILLSDLDVAIKQEPEVTAKQQMMQIRGQVED